MRMHAWPSARKSEAIPQCLAWAWAAVRAQVCLPSTARCRAQCRASALPTLRRAAHCMRRHSSPVAHASLRVWPAPLPPKLPTHSAAVAHPDACAPREHPRRTTSASTSCGLKYHAARDIVRRGIPCRAGWQVWRKPPPPARLFPHGHVLWVPNSTWTEGRNALLDAALSRTASGAGAADACQRRLPALHGCSLSTL